MDKIDKWFDDQKLLPSGGYSVSELDIEELIHIVRANTVDTICGKLKYDFEGSRDIDSLEDFINGITYN